MDHGAKDVEIAQGKRLREVPTARESDAGRLYPTSRQHCPRNVPREIWRGNDRTRAMDCELERRSDSEQLLESRSRTRDGSRARAHGVEEPVHGSRTLA